MAAPGGLTANVATAQALAGAGPENTTLPNVLPGFFLGGLARMPAVDVHVGGHRHGGVASDGQEHGMATDDTEAEMREKEGVAYLRGGVESGDKTYAAALAMNAAELSAMRFDPTGVAHPGLVTPSKVAGVSRTEQQVLALGGAVSGGLRDAPQAGIILP